MRLRTRGTSLLHTLLMISVALVACCALASVAFLHLQFAASHGTASAARRAAESAIAAAVEKLLKAPERGWSRRQSPSRMPLPPCLADFDTAGRTRVQPFNSTADSTTLEGYYRGSGDFTVDGDLMLNGAVLYVDGSLTVRGGVKGEGAVITTARLSVDGNTSLDSTNVVALIGGTGVTLGRPGTSHRFSGLVYSGGPFEASHMQLNGAFIARSTVRLEASRILHEAVRSRVAFEVKLPPPPEPPLPEVPGTTGSLMTSLGGDGVQLEVKPHYDPQTGRSDLRGQRHRVRRPIQRGGGRDASRPVASPGHCERQAEPVRNGPLGPLGMRATRFEPPPTRPDRTSAAGSRTAPAASPVTAPRTHRSPTGGTPICSSRSR